MELAEARHRRVPSRLPAEDMSVGAIQVETSKLLDNPKVAAAIDELISGLASSGSN